jgi:type II secretory pathway component PulF
MPTDQPADGKFATALSWAACLLTLVCLGLLAWYIPRDRAAFKTLFADFHMELPSVTQVMLAIPDVAFPLAAGVAAAGAIFVQLRVRTKASAALFHVLVLLGCAVVYAIYRECMTQPFYQTIQIIHSPASR